MIVSPLFIFNYNVSYLILENETHVFRRLRTLDPLNQVRFTRPLFTVEKRQLLYLEIDVFTELSHQLVQHLGTLGAEI
jgi:hypothetical protein